MNSRSRASVVCIHEERILLVHLRDPLSKVVRLFPPGGQIEEGESPAQAAEREAWEETGHRVRVDPRRTLAAHYPFYWKNRWVECTTHFFWAALESERGIPVLDPIQVGVSWEPVSQLGEILAFCPPILQAVETVMRFE